MDEETLRKVYLTLKAMHKDACVDNQKAHMANAPYDISYSRGKIHAYADALSILGYVDESEPEE